MAAESCPAGQSTNCWRADRNACMTSWHLNQSTKNSSKRVSKCQAPVLQKSCGQSRPFQGPMKRQAAPWAYPLRDHQPVPSVLQAWRQGQCPCLQPLHRVLKSHGGHMMLSVLTCCLAGLASGAVSLPAATSQGVDKQWGSHHAISIYLLHCWRDLCP